MSQTVIKNKEFGFFRKVIRMVSLKKKAFFSKARFKGWGNVLGILGLSALIFFASFLI